MCKNQDQVCKFYTEKEKLVPNKKNDGVPKMDEMILEVGKLMKLKRGT